jgi:undecaprenyl-diphosphatase
LVGQVEAALLRQGNPPRDKPRQLADQRAGNQRPRWLGRVDPVVLTAALLLAAGLGAFALLAVAVRAGSTQALDERILLSLRNPNDLKQPLGSPRLADAGRDLTALGGVVVLTLLTQAVACYLLLVRRFRGALFVLGSTLGGMVVSTLLKGFIHRDRPTVVPHLADFHSTSFPSGHSLLSAVIYFTLGVLVARLVRGRGQKALVLGVAALIPLLVGVSRVYLGVHYPTDVLAGWSAGLAWTMACWLVAWYLQQRGAVEPVTD